MPCNDVRYMSIVLKASVAAERLRDAACDYEDGKIPSDNFDIACKQFEAAGRECVRLAKEPRS